MTLFLHIVFWLCTAFVAYTYALYPLWLAVRPRFRRASPGGDKPLPQSVSIILAAHNEAANVTRRLGELTALLAASGLKGEIIVVSDGSTDDTARLAREFEECGVRVLELPEMRGKAAALTEAAALASYEILVFGDMRQRWAEDVFEHLLKNFADPTVGGVSGELMLESAPGVMAGVALYWRVEKWLRKRESRAYSMVGASGAISAVRRELFRPIPPGTLLDDVYWPLQVCLQGYRVVHESRAVAFDRLPDRPREEFRRKVRTLTGNFQLAALLPAALVPWRNPVWLELVSHKLLRLAAPWALLGMLFLSAALPGWFYQAVFFGQLACYALALLGLVPPARSLGLASIAAAFLVLNAACWVAFWVWVTRRGERAWRKIVYAPPVKPPPRKPATTSTT